MVEAIRRFPPSALFGITPTFPQPKIREVPAHLWRSTLKARRQAEGGLPEEVWGYRARAVEEYVQDVIASQTNIVENVTINPKRDAEGPDLVLNLIAGFPISKILIEVKSSTQVIRNYKLKIRDSLPEGERDMEHVTKWLVDRNIILINGGTGEDDEEKTPEEILNDSFYPQLERIKQKALINRNIEVQIFPEVQTA